MRTPKRLSQDTLTIMPTAVYTAPIDAITQVTEIWIANTSETDVRKVSIYAHGLEKHNALILDLYIEPLNTKIIDGCKIVLSSTETLGGKQHEGSDVVITAYGVEEV